MKKLTVKRLFNYMNLNILSYDLIAIKVEKEDTYLIIKCSFVTEIINNKFLSPGTMLPGYTFRCLLQESFKPIVLNDTIIDLEDAKEYCTQLTLYGIQYKEREVRNKMSELKLGNVYLKHVSRSVGLKI